MGVRGPGENINESGLGDRMAVGRLRSEGRDSLSALRVWNGGRATRRILCQAFRNQGPLRRGMKSLCC